MKLIKLILGSSSRFRKDILEKEGYIFEVVNPDLDERAIHVPDIYERPLVLARAKADAVLDKINKDEEAVVIASDQVVICNGELREKPESEEQIRKWLKDYGEGEVAEAITAVVVVNTKTKQRYEGVDKAKVFFKPIPKDVVDEFIKKDDPFSRAGGYGIKETALSPYVLKIESTIESVTGMPVHLLRELLTQAGYPNVPQ